MPTWNLAPDFAMSNLQREILDRRLENDGEDAAPEPATSAPSAPSAALTYPPSLERRRANLAYIVSRTRKADPEGAAQMEQLFNSADVIGQIGAVVAPYGYSIYNVADAYALYWMTAWEGARGSNRNFSRSEMQAVQSQTRKALLATPQIARMSDADKQQMAEAMWIQIALIDGTIEKAKQDPALMAAVQRSIREGASATGLDLDAIRLTENGFVTR